MHVYTQSPESSASIYICGHSFGFRGGQWCERWNDA